MVRGIMRERAFDAIDGERAYQEKKWGHKTSLDTSIGDFLCYIGDYTNQAKYELTHHGKETALHSVRKIAALAVAAMELHGARTRGQEQHDKDEPQTEQLPGFDEILKAATGQMPPPTPEGGESLYNSTDDLVEREFADAPESVKDIMRNMLNDLPIGGSMKVIRDGVVIGEVTIEV